MTTFFTKLASAFTLLALVATVVPATTYAADAGDIILSSSVALTDAEVGTWTTDRQNPSSWASAAESDGRTDVLTVGVNPPANSGTFYRTEGKKKVLNNVSSIETELYIDPVWQTTAARAGLWATGNGAVGEWGIIDFTTAHGYTPGGALVENPTFRTWNSTTGEWTTVAIPVAYGAWVTLRVEIANGAWNYFIDGVQVGSVPVDAPDTLAIKEVILNQYNFSAEAPENVEVGFGQGAYIVQWHGLNAVSLFSSLAAAVAAASDGDVIAVPAGTYVGNISLDKAVTLQGSVGATIQGQVTINHEDVTVSGFTITNPSGAKGVIINGVGNVSINGNHFTAIGSDVAFNENTHAVWFQDGSSDADDIAISTNTFDTIGHAAGKSAVAIGIGDSTGASSVNRVTINGNTMSGIRSSRGAYGVLVNHASGVGANTGATTGLEITGNTISDLEGAWTHAIGLEGTTPGALVSENVISDLRVTAGADNAAVFFESNSGAGSVHVNGNSFGLGTAMGVAMHPAFMGSYTIDATENYWGGANPLESVSATAGSVIEVSPWLGDEEGDEVVAVNDSDSATSATSSDGIVMTVTVAEGTVITGDESWDGDVSAALEVTATATSSIDSIEIDGFMNILPAGAIMIGSNDNSLTLSNAARIVFAGQAGKLVGWTTDSDGQDFTPITTVCDADVQATVDAQLGAGADCAMDSGADLVVWTKHFTTFVSYTADSVHQENRRSSGGSSRRDTTVASTGQVSGGQVLGASTYNFTVDLSFGSTGADVNELQQVLIDAGLLNIPAPTGWFGPMTRTALAQWQAAHGVAPAVGYFGPLTRAAFAQ